MWLFIVFAVYLLVLAGIGVYCARFNRTLADFVIGGRRLGPWVAALSAQASDMSAWLLIGLPAMAYAGGLSVVWAIIGCLAGSVFNWVLAGFGPAAIAAQGLSMRVMMLMLAFMGPGVSRALVPIVGFNFGARDYGRMWRTWLTASLWLSGIGVVLSSVIIVFAPQILAPFAHEPDLLRLSVWALRAKVSARA